MIYLLKGWSLKRIVKTTEPKSLTNYRSTIKHEDLEKSHIYEDFPHKTKEDCDNDISENLRKHLLEEQGYICCYCMSRISCQKSKIEHFKPQTKYRAFQIDYNNLFVACLGGEGQRGRVQFCDTKKGEDEVSAINLLSNLEDDVFYEKAGKDCIVIGSTNSSIEDDINTIINLNATSLQKSRRETYDRVRQKLQQKKWAISAIRQTIKYYQSKHNGKFEPYCQMIVYFLTKKLKSKGV